MTMGGEGEKGGREAARWGGRENEGKTCAKTSPKEKKRKRRDSGGMKRINLQKPLLIVLSRFLLREEGCLDDADD